MNKSTRRFVILTTMLLNAIWAFAQDGTHWQCNLYDYQYDMTVYFSLMRKETPVSDQDGYEVAAFVGEECRGVASFLSPASSTKRIGYFRIRSNQTEGEEIKFKCYHSGTGEEYQITQTLPFSSQGLTGMPSSPFELVFNVTILGDVNDDGRLGLSDAVVMISKILGEDPDKFNTSNADINGDGVISVTDAVQVIDMILKQ